MSFFWTKLKKTSFFIGKNVNLALMLTFFLSLLISLFRKTYLYTADYKAIIQYVKKT
jgi:hypothetical protein